VQNNLNEYFCMYLTRGIVHILRKDFGRSELALRTIPNKWLFEVFFVTWKEGVSNSEKSHYVICE
jgi:hypothetical protein